MEKMWDWTDEVLTVHQDQMPFTKGYWRDSAVTRKIAELLAQLSNIPFRTATVQIASMAPVYKKGLSGHPGN